MALKAAAMIEPWRSPSENDLPLRRLVVMPDHGGAVIWVSRHVREKGVGLECCHADAACGDHPLSSALLAGLVGWYGLLQAAEPLPDEDGLNLDWPAFHQQGLALARRLKSEVGPAIRVVYAKASEDPQCEYDGWCEILAGGECRHFLPPPHVPPHLPFDIADVIVSGGQTGVDRAALDFAIAHGIPHGGWCPKGRRSDDGPIPPHYRLNETESEGYRQRTKRNVADSDATLILNLGELDGGSLQTLRFAERMRKPARVVQLDRDYWDVEADNTRHWLVGNAVSALNIAGPKESKRPGIYLQAVRFLDSLTSP